MYFYVLVVGLRIMTWDTYYACSSPCTNEQRVLPPKHQVASGAKSNTNPISIAGAIWNLCPQICEPVSRSPKPTRYASDYKPRRLASFKSKLNKNTQNL